MDVERRDGVVWILVAGDLDLGSAPRVEAALTEAMAQPGPIAVDLSHLRFVDSLGMRCLLRAGMEARRAGRSLSVRRAPRSVQRVFDLMRAERVLDFVD